MKLPAGLVPLERDLTARFATSRGSFDVPAALFEDGAEHELAVRLASNLPSTLDGQRATVTYAYRRDGSATVSWRKVRVIIEPA